MPLVKYLVGGLIGGLIGGAVWVAIGYFTGYEVGYIAWGVGFLVGLGVRLAAPDEGGYVPGGTAVVVAVLSVLGAKFLVATLLVSSVLGGTPTSITITDDMLLTRLADEVAKDVQQSGQQLVWPNGGSLETASQEADYPPHIWAEAKNRWGQLTQPQRDARRAMAQMEVNRALETISNLRGNAFAASFSPWDLLWFGLAAFTAFRVGSGLTTSDD